MKKNTKTILIITAIAAIVAVAGILAVRDNKPVVEPIPNITEAPTVEPTTEPTVTPTEVPVVEPTETPAVTETPVATLTDVPVETPTVEPTEAPVEPTATPRPEPTSTPVPTATPTPTPTSTPTPKPDCKHEETGTALVGETKTEYKYQETCDACGAVLDEFTKPKATPTPTPKPTDKPVPTPTPTPKVEVVDEYVDRNGNTIIEYADRSETTIWKEYTGFLPKTATVISYKSHFKPAYKEVNGTTREYSSLIGDELLLYFEKETVTKEDISFYMYYYFDGETEEWTSRLVNSDGSFNKHSGMVIDGFYSGFESSSKAIWEGNKRVGRELEYVNFMAELDQKYYIYPEEFIYFEDGVIKLYEY